MRVSLEVNFLLVAKFMNGYIFGYIDTGSKIILNRVGAPAVYAAPGSLLKA